MKKLLSFCLIFVLSSIGYAEEKMAKDSNNANAQAMVSAQGDAPKAEAYNFGDFKSSTLVAKAWAALERNDIEAVLAYSNKNIEMYAETARKMQGDLKDYVSGSNDDIFKMWALNDVATSYYQQGEAYRKANMKEESKEAFNKLIKNYTYGQCWDPKGWFWKPTEAAKEKLAMIESGLSVDFGDFKSSTLVAKAWASLAANDLNAVVAYVNKINDLYAVKAHGMQTELKDYAAGTNDEIFKYWALNDVGTGLFVLGEAYRQAGKKDEASAVYKKLVDEYFYAQCWDSKGWFWKPAEAAQQKLGEMSSIS